ncbi:glycoside hydrolase 43 family protein [Flavobacterium sp. HJJ]|uniref:glycoside hydrolase family 43 protein n=1 Tax=Flavobacterium sp. HJJ TaxID=2783792 RepID=UPI00188AFF50|nr:glycoside hydrolase 43 family protein [Flavobacterium sp. HJJ]MBF4469949.1 glycoside hydrolase 43 family protein [Flavobacterium sp. HJJ]
MKLTKITTVFLCCIAFQTVIGQEKSEKQYSKVWTADNGDGTYKNPILYADYSDPDAIRVGDDYYMTASSFNCIPGLPILHSSDLVNWKIIGYALAKQKPIEVYDKAQHGNGVWAPCIRFHNSEFYIYYPDPDFGIYVVKAKNPAGPWSEPVMVKEGKGLIDPSPLWDDNGKTYLAYAFAGSRAGIKSILAICTMNAEGSAANNDDVMIINGHPDEATIEGPKFYKRNGYYYIFAPAGGVATGWQTVMRSKNVFGPYEKKKVMDQGKTAINGPHQGAWVQTQTGEDWFIHFQDQFAYGRVVHLQPMKWENNWPVIGNDDDKNGIGEPVMSHKKPNVGKKTFPIETPPDSDEFNSPKLGLQWQWHANPQIVWGFPTSMGYYSLNCIPVPKEATTLYQVSNLLLQKFPSNEFTATAKIKFNARFDGESMGLVIMGLDYSYLCFKQEGGKMYLSQKTAKNIDKKGTETESTPIAVNTQSIYMQAKIKPGGICTFYYSENGQDFTPVGEAFTAREGRWIGAKIGFTALRQGVINDAGNVEIDWFRITK